MSFDMTEHKCVDKAKVNSLVRSLETMKNEKSDLKMAVYKQFDSLGEQFNDILYENSSTGCDVNSSCCIIPIRSQLTQQILDDADAMQRAQFALEGHDVMHNLRDDSCLMKGAHDAFAHDSHFENYITGKHETSILDHAHSELEDYITARKRAEEDEICRESNDCGIEQEHCVQRYPSILFENTCDESVKSCENPMRGQPLRQIEDDPEAMKRAKQALDDADDSSERKHGPKMSSLAATDMSVFGAIGGRVRHMCRNCDKNEVTTDRKAALCSECQLYQQQYNKPRPMSIRENKCLYCCATIWLEGKCDEVLYCDKCKHKVLSTTAKEIPSTEYDTRRDEYKHLRLSAIKENDLVSKKIMELEPMAIRKDARDPFSMQARRPLEMDLAAKKNEDFLQLEPISRKAADFHQAISKKKEAKDDAFALHQISKPKDSFFVKELELMSKRKDSKETTSVRAKEPMNLKERNMLHAAPEMGELQPITRRTEAKETLAIKVKEPFVVEPAIKKKGHESIALTVKESMDLETVKSSKGTFSTSVPTYRRSSSRTLSADYGGEQCSHYCEWGDIRPFIKKKSKNDCVTGNQSDDRFALRGVIKNQSYDQTEQAREGCSSGSSGLREHRTSEENLLLDAKRSSDSVTSCGVELNGSELDVSFSGFDYSPFKRDDTSAEPENNALPAKFTSSTSVTRKPVDEREPAGVVEMEGAAKADVVRGKEEIDLKCNRDLNSKDRYCFEDIEAYPLLSDKVSKSEI